ncbi:MAG: DUF2085 domain-containing protein [Chloroflexaceae bacterium]
MSEKTPDEVLELARRQIAARREAEQHQQMQTQQTQTRRERPWRYIFLGVMGTLLLALLFTPGLPLQWKMYAVVHGVCAQQHNIFIGELQVPICARNSGIYISFLITMIYFWVIGRGRAGRIPPWPIAAVLIAFVVVMGIDGFNSLFLDLGLPYLYTPRNELRTLTGMGMGVGVATVMLLILNTTLRQNVDDQQPLLKSWRELGGVLLLDFLILVALYGNLELLYWPLAFLSFTGIISVLYLVSLLLVSLFMGYEGRVTHPAQLAKPATIALLPTLVMLAALSGLRFWLEAQGLII